MLELFNSILSSGCKLEELDMNNNINGFVFVDPQIILKFLKNQSNSLTTLDISHWLKPGHGYPVGFKRKIFEQVSNMRNLKMLQVNVGYLMGRDVEVNENQFYLLNSIRNIEIIQLDLDYIFIGWFHHHQQASSFKNP